MLYVFYGNDAIRVRKEALSFVGSFEKEGSAVEKITSDQYREGMFVDLSGTASLFGEKQVIIIDSPSEDRPVFDAAISAAQTMAESDNVFVIIEGKILAPEKKKLAKYANKIEESKMVEKKFNPFTMTDALVQRDKKRLWILLNEAKNNGSTGEEIIGVLYWQIKTLRIAEVSKDADEAGMKPFTFSKAKGALLNFKEGETDKMSKNILTVYHEAHLGITDMDIGLEKFVLGL